MAQSQTHNYTFLPDPAEEDALHANRLLSIEERPFAKVLKRLQDPLLKAVPTQQATPPPEGEDNVAAEDDSAKRKRFREEMLLDFAGLESSIMRIQLIQSSNARERQRYAAEKAKIQATAQSVRENTLLLREQLAEAQKVLELRKGYDELAAKILDDKKLKSRDEAGADIRGLEKEIEELEAESQEYEHTWIGRREQFDRVVAEGETMIKLIKGIKDEPKPEEDEQMDEGAEGEESTKADRSRMGTPAPEEGSTPRPEEGGATPMPDSGGDGGATPRPANRFLEVEDSTRNHSRTASPARHAGDSQLDIEMVESTLEPETEAQPKTSTGMEATAEQVAQPAEGVNETMDES